MQLDKFAYTIPMALVVGASQARATVPVSAERESSPPEMQMPVPDRFAVTGNILSVEAEATSPELTNQLLVMHVPRAISSWQQVANRFDDLVTREAVGTITPTEMQELDWLQELRRQLVSPPTGEEILRRHRREKLDRGILKALGKYVQVTPIETH